MCNYWLIPMDYQTCNYKQMQDEWEKNKKIMWQVPGTPKKRKDKMVIEGSMANRFSKTGFSCRLLTAKKGVIKI